MTIRLREMAGTDGLPLSRDVADAIPWPFVRGQAVAMLRWQYRSRRV
jgi:hypothetical protein